MGFLNVFELKYVRNVIIATVYLGLVQRGLKILWAVVSDCVTYK